MSDERRNTPATRLHWKQPNSLKLRCKELGVDYWRALKRRQAGMTEEQIFAAQILPRQSHGNAVTVNNVQYPSLEEAVRQLRPIAHSQTIARWMAAGMSADEAFKRTPNPGYREGVVYLIFHMDSGKGYVGVSVRGTERRMADHLNAAISGAIKHTGGLHAAIRKYGAENFLVTIIDHGNALVDLGEKERLHIQNHQTMTPHGFNIVPGGNVGGSTPKRPIYKGKRYPSVQSLVEHIAQLKGISEAAAKWRLRHDRIDAKATPKFGTGVSQTPAYKTWSGIVHCRTNPASKQFRSGLSLFDPWRCFDNFLADVGQPPGAGYALVRRDQCQGYHPLNCLWLTKSEASKLNAAHMKKIGTLVGNRRRSV
jgi:hypothetical protein